MNCKYCDNQALTHVDPPLCEKHLDLAIVSEFLNSQDQPVTMDNVRATRARCLASGGRLSITDEDIQTMMTGPFARDCRVVIRD